MRIHTHAKAVTRYHTAMASSLFCALCFLYLLRCLATVRASALTTSIGANERLCFYADVDKAGEKIGVCTLIIFSLSAY